MRITNMNRFIFLVIVFLVACSKEQDNAPGGENFQKLKSHMWKLDSIVFLGNNGRRDVSIPTTMHSQFVKFTSTEIQYYYNFHLQPPVHLESHAATYKRPNILEALFPGRTSGPPSYKIIVDSVSDTRLRYNFLNTPDYAKTREYYYHAY